MKERPIIFSTPMVKATLNGLKTMTRRVVALDLSNLDWDENDPEWLHIEDCFGDWHDLIEYSPYKKDDLLYVREAFCNGEYVERFPCIEDSDYFIDQNVLTNTIIYKADIFQDDYYNEELDHVVKWRPSIFLNKEDSRLWLKVISVRVEKLQVISEADIISEGWGLLSNMSDKKGKEMYLSFADFWDKLNKKRGYGWDKNPYVWVYEYEVFNK